MSHKNWPNSKITRIKILKQFIRHTFSDTLYVYIKLLGKTFSLGPDEARSNLSKACL